VEFLGWFKEPDTLYIAMEALEEGDLTDYIGRPLHQKTVQNISKQILEGLKVMHHHGIAHRDLKPAVCSLPPKLSHDHVSLQDTDKYIEHFCSYYVSSVDQTRGFRGVEVGSCPSYHNLSYSGVNPSVWCPRGPVGGL